MSDETLELIAPGPCVYLVQFGDEPIYKIGWTNNLKRRLFQFKVALPYEVRPIWKIPTNDPKWLELYWHKRFRAKQRLGSNLNKYSEWFNLTEEDIKLFKTSEIPQRPASGQQELNFAYHASPKEEAIYNVINHYADLKHRHPLRKSKLDNSLTWELEQLEIKLSNLSNTRLEAKALDDWANAAIRAANKKVE